MFMAHNDEGVDLLSVVNFDGGIAQNGLKSK